MPESLTRVVAKLLAKQPIQRYQEPRDLISVLLAIAHEQGLSIASRAGNWYAPADPQISVWDRHASWAVPVGILLVIVVLMEFFANPGVSIVRSDTRPSWPEAVEASQRSEKPAPTLRNETVLPERVTDGGAKLRRNRERQIHRNPADPTQLRPTVLAPTH